jgi:hypothetical protein
VALLAPCADAATTSFTTSGEHQFTVPPGVTSIHVVAVGGKGGDTGTLHVELGGFGGTATADLAVSPGQVLYAEVGGNGTNGTDNVGVTGTGAGGANGGGAGGGGSVGPFGTTFTFTLDRTSTVAFAFTRHTAGRKVKSKCVKQTRKNHRHKKCVLTTPAGTLTTTGKAGSNTLKFTGRIAGGRKLKPGSYTVVIVATDSAGVASAPHVLSFRITR